MPAAACQSNELDTACILQQKNRMSSDSVAPMRATHVSRGWPGNCPIPESKPFLSIVTRTQGRRPHTLAEVLTCLAAQTDTDFEILIIGHRLDDAARVVVDEIVSDTPLWLHNKIRLILVEDGNRTRPLNVGFAAARGEYIAVLDDDDAVFAHWVETFRKLARTEPGRLLRAVSVQQLVNTVTVQGEQGLRAEDSLNMVYPAQFNFFDHMVENRSPPVSLAFPNQAIGTHGLNFDETLTTTEDWDFMMRVACVAGVAAAAEVTSIYRWWDKGESSRTVHITAEWQANHYRIWNNWNAAPFTLPPGSVRPLVRLLEEHAAFSAELRRLRHAGVDDAVAAMLTSPDPQVLLYGARRELVQILESTSWRLTAPLRWLVVLFGGVRPLDASDVNLLNAEEAAARVWQLRHSTSWRITAPVRIIKRWISRMRHGEPSRRDP